MPRRPQLRYHKWTGQYYVHLNGKREYLGIDKAEAEVEAARKIASYLANRLHAGETAVATEVALVTIKELVLQYTQHALRYYRKPDGTPTSQIYQIKRALEYLLKHYGNTDVRAFGPKKLKDLRQLIVEDPSKPARSYVNTLILNIKRAFKWGVSEELVQESVYLRLKEVAGLRQHRTDAPEREKTKPVPDADYKKTLPHLPTCLADMARLQYHTGMRPGEVCIMRPCDIDTSADVWAYTPYEHKNQHHEDCYRVVAIGPQAQKVLAAYLQRPPTAYCFSPAESEQRRAAERHAKRKTPLSHGNKPGSRGTTDRKRTPQDKYSVTSYGRAVKRACTKAKVTPWTPNQLRHNLGTRVRAKYGAEASQHALGHKNLKTTELYAEKNWEVIRAIAEENG